MTYIDLGFLSRSFVVSLAAALLSGLSRGSEFQQMFATGCYRASTEKHASYGVNTIYILNYNSPLLSLFTSQAGQCSVLCDHHGA